ncbi:MAG: hypothetical protein IPH04_21685 [Saprospirales bacterium]|nr:hypothetical protein [Saprospirales bacterium]
MFDLFGDFFLGVFFCHFQAVPFGLFGFALPHLLHSGLQFGAGMGHFVQLFFFGADPLVDHGDLGLADLGFELAVGGFDFFMLEIEVVAVALDGALHFLDGFHQSVVAAFDAHEGRVFGGGRRFAPETFFLDGLEGAVEPVPNFGAVVAGHLGVAVFALDALEFVESGLEAEAFLGF